MKIGIDAHFVTRLPRRGIGTYSLNLIRDLVVLRPDIEFYLYIRHPDLEAVLPSAPNVRVRRLAAPLDPLWEQVVLPLAARRDGVDVLHSLGNTGPLLLAGRIRQVLSLMDVMFLQSGELVPKPVTVYQKIGRWYRALVSPRCARSAAAVITISDFSRLDIMQMIPGLGSDRLTVTHLACDCAFSATGPDTDVDQQAPFILCLGAEDPRKNTLRMVQAYLALIGDKVVTANLVVAGYKNWENSAAYTKVQEAGAKDRVKFLSFVPVPELVNLYRRATLFAYPSLYEGFGIPLLEAFSCGCPVVASNAASIPEVAGDAVIYVDPLNVQEIRQAMRKLILDADLRRALVQRGYARALEFSWAETAKQTVTVYERCIRATAQP